MEILYKVHNNLYVNLTNKCPCSCTFCLRQTMDKIGESDVLWLEREPTVEEVIAAFDKFKVETFSEIVFCGFGEPVEALDTLLPVARYVKEQWGKPLRINTNGLGNLIHGRSIAADFKGLIDTVSISLNTPNAEKYEQLVRSKFGAGSFNAMLTFAKECTQYVPNVILTTVATTLTKEEETECQKICDSIGATYRIRPWES